MEALVVIGGFIYIGVIGYWIMGELDRFLDCGDLRPYWDEEEEQESLERSKNAPQ